MTSTLSAQSTVLIIGISSGLGAGLAEHFRNKGAQVFGTSRHAKTDAQLDINDPQALEALVDQLQRLEITWDLLIFSVGILDPIGPFLSVPFEQWQDSHCTNFCSQLRVLHALRPFAAERPTVLFFAGGAMNGVLESYSAYGVAKHSLAKMVEYLDAEDHSTRYVLLGPGWVDTPIHQQTLSAGAKAGKNYERTLHALAHGQSTAFSDIAASIEWICQQPIDRIGGKNLSVVHDAWSHQAGHTELIDSLDHDKDSLTFRRVEPTSPSPEMTFLKLFEALPTQAANHARDSATYALFNALLGKAIKERFSAAEARPVQFGPFGQIEFPYFKMGAVDTCDLFGLDELILFSFYWRNRARYKRVADIGANLGLHSLLLARCGFAVRAYEPDPLHTKQLRANLSRNGATHVEVHEVGVSDHNGTSTFVRVLGNTTSSHIAGSKVPYGELEEFSISIVDVRSIAQWADLLKIDAEGHEAKIICAIDSATWQNCDAILEIGTSENATMIFDYCRDKPLHLFSQKIGWQRVKLLTDMPTSYRQGSLFITSHSHQNMPWA